MPTPIHVVHGSCDGQFDHLAGRSVGELRRALATAFNIPLNAITFVNGEVAKASQMLQPGDRVEFVKKAKRRKEKATRTQRISIIGCGQIAKCLIRPLCWHLETVPNLTVDLQMIDGDGAKVIRLEEEAGAFPVSTFTEYLVEGNAARLIEEGDVVMSCTRNTATLKLISDHVQKLANVTVIAGGCDYLDGAVKFVIRRKGKYLTLPLANHYHPEILKPTDRNPGDLAEGETMPAPPPQAIVNVNMVAAVMLSVLRRLLMDDFPEPCEFYVEANLPRVVDRQRLISKSEGR
jgi:hypothetical protein